MSIGKSQVVVSKKLDHQVLVFLIMKCSGFWKDIFGVLMSVRKDEHGA
jgi:hypothetical protein